MILKRTKPTRVSAVIQTSMFVDWVSVMGEVASCQLKQFVLNSTVYVSVCDCGTIAFQRLNRHGSGLHGLLLVNTVERYWIVCPDTTQAGQPSSQTAIRRLPLTTAVVWVFFITPDANGIHGEPEITGFPNFDREITLGKSP
jgi:hypothetical protein